MENLESEIKQLIVEALFLEDVEPGDIDSNEALFVEGLGLDSIDALELAIAIDKKFGVRIKADDENTQQVFASVHNLALFLREQMSAAAAG